MSLDAVPLVRKSALFGSKFGLAPRTMRLFHRGSGGARLSKRHSGLLQGHVSATRSREMLPAEPAELQRGAGRRLDDDACLGHGDDPSVID